MILAAALVLAVAAQPVPPVGASLSAPGVKDVIDHPTLVRPPQPVTAAGGRKQAEFLLSRPPFAAALARRLHPALDRYTLRQEGPGLYHIEDRGALRGDLRLLESGDGRQAYLATGEFRSLAHLIRFSGRTVIILDYHEISEGGQAAIEARPTLYVKIDNVIVGAVVKVLAPLVRRLMDRRLATLIDAGRAVADRIARDPAGLYRDLEGWPEISPEDREAFRRAFLAGAKAP